LQSIPTTILLALTAGDNKGEHHYCMTARYLVLAVWSEHLSEPVSWIISHHG